MPASEQVVIIFAGAEGFTDDVELKDIARFERELIEYVKVSNPDILETIAGGKKMPAELVTRLKGVIAEFKQSF